MARRVAMAVILAMAAIAMWAVSTKQFTYISTYGVSMNPVYYEGDLVFVKKASSYEVGQIAAYHGVGGIQVLHRIIGGDAEQGFVLKGDNNDSIDAITPTAEEIIGRAVLHVPDGGMWLQPILSPTSLGMLGFLFASGATARAKSRRDLPRGPRKKKVKGMSGGGGGSWATAAAVFKAVSRLHPALRVLAIATAACGLIGLALGVLGWMKPTTEAVKGTGKPGESMTFSYSAEVPRSAAYDGTTVYSPDPIFRKLANTVSLHVHYQGEPGRIEASARLASQNGWHKTLELSQPKQFATDRYVGTVELDLPSLDKRIAEAGKAIGADMGAITLAVTARVRHGDGTTFEPQVSFSLAPLQFALAGSPELLVVDQSSSSSGTSVQDRRIGALGLYPLTAAEARKYAVYLLLPALVGAGVIAWMALGHVPLRTRAQIQRRYPHLIVPVEPMASPPGKPVVIVDTFPALVKLAEKYGQMILTWTRPDGADDFVVRDEGILYRYRIDPNAATSKATPTKPTPEPTTSPKPASRPADQARSADSGSEATPVMGLPPTPEASAEVSANGSESTTTGDEAAAPVTPPVKKTTPRKRAAKTAATKTAAAKAAATKAAKSAGARAPAKRTRATTKPHRPGADAVDAPVASPTPEAGAHVEASAAGIESRSDRPEAEASQSATALADTTPAGMTPAGTPSTVDHHGDGQHDSVRLPTEPSAADIETTKPESAGAHRAEDSSGVEANTMTADTPAAAEKDEPAAPGETDVESGVRIDTPVEHGEHSGRGPSATAEPTEAEATKERQTAGTAEEEPVEAAQPIASSTAREALAGPKQAAAAESEQQESGQQQSETGRAAGEPQPSSTEARQASAELDKAIADPNPAAAKPNESKESNAEAKTASDQVSAELPTSENTVFEAEATVALEPGKVITTEQPQQVAGNQKRAGRRKSRSRRAPQPTVDEQPSASIQAVPTPEVREAREAMEDLAARNAPMSTPEPGSESEPESRLEVKPVPWPAAGAKPRPAPPVHDREPIYDFLPAAKRNVAEADEADEPDA
jgi:signal peptidase I